MRLRGNVLTMVAVVVSIVSFRAQDLAAAARIWAAMVGANGWNGGWVDWPSLHPLGGWGLLLLLAPGYLLAYLMPNTQQLMTLFEPALEWKKFRNVSPPIVRMVWRPTVGWAIFVGVVLCFGMTFIARVATKFVYFNF